MKVLRGIRINRWSNGSFQCRQRRASKFLQNILQEWLLNCHSTNRVSWVASFNEFTIIYHFFALRNSADPYHFKTLHAPLPLPLLEKFVTADHTATQEYGKGVACTRAVCQMIWRSRFVCSIFWICCIPIHVGRLSSSTEKRYSCCVARLSSGQGQRTPSNCIACQLWRAMRTGTIMFLDASGQSQTFHTVSNLLAGGHRWWTKCSRTNGTWLPLKRGHTLPPMSSTKSETVQIPILIVLSKSDVLGSLSFCSGIGPIVHFVEQVFLLTFTQLSQVLSSAGCC